MRMIDGIKWGHNNVLNLGIPADGVTASAGVLRHFVKRAGDAPVQLAIGFAGIRPIRREIAVAARREVVINGFTAGFTKGVDHIQDATADTRAEVINMYAGFVRQFFHCHDVPVG